MRMIYGNKLPSAVFVYPFPRAELRACKIGFDEYFPDLIKAGSGTMQVRFLFSLSADTWL